MNFWGFSTDVLDQYVCFCDDFKNVFSAENKISFFAEYSTIFLEKKKKQDEKMSFFSSSELVEINKTNIKIKKSFK